MVQPKEGKHMIELQSPGGWEVQNLCYIWIKLSYIYIKWDYLYMIQEWKIGKWVFVYDKINLFAG